MIQQIKKMILLCILFLYLPTYAAEVLVGDTNAQQGQSFSFALQEHVQNGAASNFYVAAKPGAGGVNNINNFSIARVNRNKRQFEGFTPEKVKIDGAQNQDNPLFDQGIRALTILDPAEGFGEQVVAVSEQDPSTAYLFLESFNLDTIALASVPNIPDATGMITSGIVRLESTKRSHVFAAAAPAGGIFGDDNSGIAMLVRGFITIKDKDDKQKQIRTFSLVTPRSIRLDTRSSQVAIDSTLATMGQIVSMHWDNALNRLFIGLQVQASGGTTDGARAIVVGRLQKNMLILSSIAPNNAFREGDQSIVGVRGASSQVSIHHVNSMFTSTGLNYLLVVGGNGEPNATKRTVFALPLVNIGTDKNIGTIAQKNAEPQDQFTNAGRFISRNISDTATQPDDMTQANNVTAQVGGGALSAGNIEEIFVRGDTVFVAVGDPVNQGLAGIYFSQALFDENSKIKGWTQWQRAAGTTNNVFGAALDPQEANFICMTGDTINEIKTVTRTTWSDGSENGLLPLNNVLQKTFTKNNGGIQGLIELLPQAPGLNNISLLISTGFSSVTLIESGQVQNQLLVPSAGNDFDAIEEFENGTITQDVQNTTIATISGGILDEVGPITTAEIARNGDTGNTAWLFVGGSGGVAVLSQNDGDGFKPNNGELGAGLNGLKNGMSFKKIGNYRFVRKLINDGTFLYVLTNSKLDRIDLTQGNVGIGDSNPITLACAGNTISPSGSFLDAIISGSFALVASSETLLRVGNGKKITDAINEDDVSWTRIDLTETANPVLQLIAVSQTGRAQDVAKGVGGHIYVCNAYAGNNRSKINRFTVKGIDNTAVQADTFTAFTDLFLQDIPSFFINFGEFKEFVATDGALYFSVRNQNGNQSQVKLTPVTPQARVGVAGVGVRSRKVAVGIEQDSQITTLIRNLASGSILIAGDFGLKVNE